MTLKRIEVMVFFYIAFILFLSYCVTGCGSMQFSPPTVIQENAPTFRHDLKVNINGSDFYGVGVVPNAPNFSVKVNPDDKIDRIIWTNCHHQEVIDRPNTGWFNKSFQFTVSENSPIEKENSCPLSIIILTEKTRRNAMALFEFSDSRPEVSVPAKIYCNGYTLNFGGVSICQSAAGLIQQIEFPKDMIHVGSAGKCAVMPKGPLKIFRFSIAEGNCTYYFGANEKAANGRMLLHRLQTIGYTEVTPR